MNCLSLPFNFSFFKICFSNQIVFVKENPPHLHCAGLWVLLSGGTADGRTPALGCDSAVAAGAAGGGASDGPAPVWWHEPSWAAHREVRGPAAGGLLKQLRQGATGAPAEGI